MPSSLQEKFESAVQLHRQGDAKSAIPMYEEVLTEFPNEAEVLYLLGTAQLQTGNFQDAIANFNKTLTQKPDATDALNNLGIAYKAIGDLDNAVKTLERAAESAPNYGQALFNLSTLLIEKGEFAKAKEKLEIATQNSPEDVEIWTSLGTCCSALQEWELSESAWREAKRLKPEVLDYSINLGAVLARQHRYEESLKLCEEVVAQKPDFYQAFNNLSFIHERLGHVPEAIKAAEKSLELNSEFAEAWNNLGTAKKASSDISGAIEAYQKALTISPQFALAKFNLGTAQLLSGEFQKGWQNYEARKDLTILPKEWSSKPAWTGSDISGKTLLIHVDQGFGDTIQFVRFLPKIKSTSGAKVVLVCQDALINLLSKVAGADEIVSESQHFNSSVEHEYQLSLLSSGLVLGLDETNLGMIESYLPTFTDLPEAIESQINEAKESFKVGLIWQGNPNHARDKMRSISLEQLKPVVETESTAFFSIQVDAESQDVLKNSALSKGIVNAGESLTDFAETAALLNSLDLLITVDTACAHLAGALNVPTCLLLDSVPDWRWQLNREDTAWYPSIKIFRQSEWGNWDTVITNVRSDLESRNSSK